MKDIIEFLFSIVTSIAQVLALFVITVGMFKGVKIYIKDIFLSANSAKAINESRMELGHSFSLGLGFLIGASILQTAIAPTWNDIGQLAAIIAIRTTLNYFLIKDVISKNH